MSKSQSLAVDFTQTNDVLQILPRSPLRSSENSGWQDIYVQQHLQPAWETPEYAHTRHMLLIHSTTQTVQAERVLDGRRRSELLGDGNNNNIAIVPAAIQHQVNWDRESPFSLIFLEPSYLTQVARDLLPSDRLQLVPRYAMHDPLIDQIGRLLVAELDANSIGSRMFVDSLKIALSIHLLRHYSDLQQPLREDTGGLPQRKLQQAIAYINERLTEDLTIAAIAEELEMSQYYFSRLFKRSMGVSPYQYVMQQRIERAAYLLRTTSLSVAAIATQVGFLNQNQLTIQFRKFIGTTPSNYRKQI